MDLMLWAAYIAVGQYLVTAVTNYLYGFLVLTM